MWQTIGQDRIINFLKESIERNSLAHAYLFVGPPHVGKMTVSIDLAKALNCSNAEPPCGQCRICQRIGQGKHPDVIHIDKNAGRDPKDRKKATEISIDAIRELMQRSANLPPFEGKFKIFIIDNADLMSAEAANCLLKTLEEPPPHVIIILLTAEEKMLLPTVVSRCQRFELKPIPAKEIEARLSLIDGMSAERRRLLARLSGGCLGWAMSATKDESFFRYREVKQKEFSSLLTSGWDERLSYIQQLSLDRNDAEDIIKLWLSWCRDVLLIKYNCDAAINNLDRMNDLRSWANILTVIEIKEFIDGLNKALNYLFYNANLHLVFEVLMLDMPKKEKRAEQILHPVSSNL